MSACKVTTLVIGSDHAGYEMKEYLIKALSNRFTISDVGTFSKESCDYPDIAKSLAQKVLNTENSFGILVCGTGIGMNIAVNKFPGIRCANVTSKEFAILAKQHNNANVLALSGRFVSEKENLDIVNAYLDAEFEPRHLCRVQKIVGEN